MSQTGSTMYQAFHEVAVSRLTQEALVCGPTRMTYGELLEKVDQVAIGLNKLGVMKGDRVGCFLPPGPEFVILFFAVSQLGAVIVPLNPQTRSLNLKHILLDSTPKVVVSIQPLDLENSEYAPPHFLAIEGSHGVEKLIASLPVSENGALTPLGEVLPGDLLALLYTSGTTGTPKGTMHSHKSMIAPVAASVKLRQLWLKKPNLVTLGQTARALARYKARLLRAAGRPQTFLSTTGWHTITGLEVMLQAILMGDRLVIMPRFHPREALRLVEEEDVTILVAVPMVFQLLLGLEDFEKYDTSSLLICGTGAAPCPASLARRIQQGFGCAIHIGFGATETAGGISATSIADSDEVQAETVGRPMPGMEVKIVDEQHHELPRGSVGELAIRSDSVMIGYYNDPEATAQVIDSEGWYYTGDLAILDEKGYLRIVGRKKDVIIRGGQNIYPAEIEGFLASHPGIREAAVVGVPDSVGGEVSWAFVILQPGASLTTQELLSYCRDHLEPYKVPACIHFVEEFPRSENGKPKKYELRSWALSGQMEVRAK